MGTDPAARNDPINVVSRALLALAPISVVIAAWFVLDGKATRASEDAKEAKDEVREIRRSISGIDVRLERIQTTLETVVKSHEERLVKAEVQINDAIRKEGGR